MESRSRDASAPELCQRHSQNRPAEQDRVTLKAGGGTGFRLDHAPQTKGKRNAGRRISPNLRALRARLALSGARSPVGVPPRLSPEGLSSPRLSVGPGFPGLSADKRRSSPRRRRPRLQRCTSHAGHGAGRLMPKPPGSGGDEPPPAGTALAPSTGVAGWRPFGERDSRFYN